MRRPARSASSALAVVALVTGLLPSRPLGADGPPLPDNVERLDSLGGITQYRLRSNGMTLLLAPDHAAPVFTFMVVYHVGSRDEAPGNTGSAHLLEHLIFNRSTESFGAANGHPSFQDVLFEAGADFRSTNMTTWNDRMNGYSTLPSGRLELAMRIEADRLRRGLILDEERQIEMTVVRNEYEIGENDPQNALWKAVVAAAIVAHPYHWDTIGYRSDIEGVPTSKLREHYDTFFWPDNAEAILVGSVDPGEALRLFDAHFGAFPRAPKPIPRVITVEPPQEGERRVVVHRPSGVGLVMLAYTRPGALHPDFVPFEVLSEVLAGGVASRLHQQLVETGLASGVAAYNFALRDPYPLLVQATVAPGKKHPEVEAALRRALAEIARGGVGEAEIARAKRQIEVRVARQRDGSYALASNLGEAVASADWKWFLSYPERVQAVSAADLQRVAATYLTDDRTTVGWYLPGATGAAVAEPPVPPQPGPEKGDGSSASSTDAAVSAAPPDASFAARTVRRELANGVVVDVVANPAAPTVAIEGVLLAGDAFAPDGHPALPALTATMVQRGAGGRSKLELATLLADAGARLAVDSDTTETTISGDGLARDLPLLLEILADTLGRPDFPAGELDKARSELESAVLQRAESTSFRAMERLGQLALPVGHPYRAAGAEAWVDSLRRATLDQVRDYHRQRYAGSTLRIAVVGDVVPAEVVALCERLFGALPRGEQPRGSTLARGPAAATTEVVTMPGKANMNIVLGQASRLRRADDDYHAALLANAAFGQTALSSRIGKRIRDAEGLSYSLWSRFRDADLYDGLWLANVNVAPENLAPALAALREELARYAEGGMTGAELAVQQSYFAGNYQVRLGSNAGVAAALAAAERIGEGPAYLDDYPRRIRAVTLEEANAAFRRHLDPARLQLVVAGDLQELPGGP